MKTLNVLGICLLALLFFTSCAHESRSPSSSDEKEASAKFHQVRSSSFRN